MHFRLWSQVSEEVRVIDLTLYSIGTAAGGPPSGQNGSFGYQSHQSDHELDDRYSNSSFGSSSHASTDKQPSTASASQSAAGAVQGNQLSVEVDDTNPWK